MGDDGEVSANGSVSSGRTLHVVIPLKISSEMEILLSATFSIQMHNRGKEPGVTRVFPPRVASVEILKSPRPDVALFPLLLYSTLVVKLPFIHVELPSILIVSE